jgi:hypothetical protein
VGAAAGAPDAKASPAATHIEVTVSKADQRNLVRVRMAPCGGQVLVSPVVPGVLWLAP